MTTTKNQDMQKSSNAERTTLITTAAIMGGFVLFVCIATNMSLAYYTAPHFILTLAVLAVLLFGTRHKTLVRTAMVLGVIGAIVALFLTAAYLPYYAQHVEYMNSLN